MKILSLIVPVYNEERTLKGIIEKTLSLDNEAKKQGLDLKVEVVIVDDCSKDNSFKIAKSIALENKNVKVFQHKKNLGKGAALKTGFINANGDFIGIQDADNEYNPVDYLKMVRPLMEDRADVCYGSRSLKQDERRILYFWHTFMNKSLTFLTNMYTNLDITDMEVCYKLFRADIIKKIAPKLKENRFGFEPEVTVYVAKGKYRLIECAISYNPRSYEEGKKIKAKDGLRALYCILHYGAHCAALPMQFILYLFIGAFSALVNIFVFMILVKSFSLFYSVALAFIVSALVNYLLCIALLFRHKARWNSFGEILAYIITLIIMGLIDYYSTYWFLIVGFNNFFAKVFSNLIGVIGNFLLRKYFVFPEKIE